MHLIFIHKNSIHYGLAGVSVDFCYNLYLGADEYARCNFTRNILLISNFVDLLGYAEYLQVNTLYNSYIAVKSYEALFMFLLT